MCIYKVLAILSNMSENESKSFLSSLKEAVLPRTENTEGSTPMALPDDAPVEISAEVQELLERGAHFGHKKSKNVRLIFFLHS